MKVLIIEDDICTALMLKQLFDIQHKVQIAHSGPDAIQISLQFKPELIISDWNLHGEIDGVSACKEISEHCKPIIILVSGSPVDQLKIVAEALSPRHIFAKPLNVENFSILVKKIEGEFKKTP